MRVIRLDDGRICQIQQGFTERAVPAGRTVALATIIGQPRFGLELPADWRTLHEVELRGAVEAWMRAHRHAADTLPTRSAAVVASGLRRTLARWFTPPRGTIGQA